MTLALRKESPSEQDAETKELILRHLMRDFKTVLVAFSGGVDSSYLASIASQELGRNALCVTGVSPSVSEFQLSQAKSFAEKNGFRHLIIETEEMNDPKYRSNPTNRCYFCKSELYSKLAEIASERKIAVVLDGANHDDLSDFRPGKKAAEEFNVRSVLAEVGFSKEDVRAQSKKNGLETWDKPASPCLASRVKYGLPVTIERLGKVERSEQVLRSMGFQEFRVRVHGRWARVEISADELPRALEPETSDEIVSLIGRSGFERVEIDTKGFRSGSMNRDTDISL